jgi:hypothetical protein
MAALQGPCPRCGEEIVAPNPATGRGAHFPEPTPRPVPAVPISAEIPEAADMPLRAPALLLSALLTAIVCLPAGYFLGLGSRPEIADAVTVSAPPPAPPPPPVAESAEPAPPPTVVRDSEPIAKPEPVKASAAAEATLKAFLEAPDWAARAAYALSPETVRPLMEEYSRKTPDRPTPYQSISIQNSYTNKSTGATLFVFQVVTDAHPAGIPVAVAETEGGWFVDWRAFVEFRDDRFRTFTEGPVDASGRFHLIVTTPPAEGVGNTSNEHFSSFALDPPVPGRQHLAYVRKPSELHETLTTATADGAICTPYLELAKRQTPDGKSYIEITGIVASDWLPEGW